MSNWSLLSIKKKMCLEWIVKTYYKLSLDGKYNQRNLDGIKLISTKISTNYKMKKTQN